jgi:GNAT superfamily N-acetyltransferase
MWCEREDGYVLTDETSAIDREQLFAWLSTDAYWWSGGLRRSVLDAALDASLCFSVLTSEHAFVGFGRMVTDRATFAYWSDVYVAPEHRGQGLGSWLTETALAHPELVTCRRILLATRDAHEIYQRCGFLPLADPAMFMEISRPTAGGAPRPVSAAHATRSGPATVTASAITRLPANRRSMSPLVLRRAVLADADAMRDLAQRAYQPYLVRMARRPRPMDADYGLAIEKNETWVVEDGSGIVAFLILVAGSDHVLLENMAVDPGQQGQGIGRELLRFAEDRTRALEQHEIRLYTNAVMTENQQMYEKAGYVETGRTTDHGFNRVHYRKPIDG